MSAYFIANIRIHDEEEYQKYLTHVDDVFRKFNGTYLSLDKNPMVLEGVWDYSRLALIEFPDKESLLRWYHSDDYQTILKHRLLAAQSDTIVVES